eukprot:5643359-Prymnesium_polylepis.1
MSHHGTTGCAVRLCSRVRLPYHVLQAMGLKRNHPVNVKRLAHRHRGLVVVSRRTAGRSRPPDAVLEQKPTPSDVRHASRVVREVLPIDDLPRAALLVAELELQRMRLARR